jgi:NADH-quinone oxidoreductase subunit L
VQTDIKRVLAYSTISQIGFMLVALGVCTSLDPALGGSGYTASLFHLFTHAFFKALLFLCAGSIIHAVHSNEMSAMGGLRRYLPITHATFLIACLSISGVPPLSGYFSKHEILSACFHFSPWMGITMSVIACLTAFYMFRLYFRIFWNRPYESAHGLVPHESPYTMTIPLMLLALITCVSGFVPFGEFVSSNGLSFESHGGSASWLEVMISNLAPCFIIGSALVYYKSKNLSHLQRLWIYRPAVHRFYIDEVYQFITHRIIFRCISAPAAWFDRHVVDGSLNLLARGTYLVSVRIRGIQSGDIQQYTIVFLGGALVLVLLLLLI